MNSNRKPSVRNAGSPGYGSSANACSASARISTYSRHVGNGSDVVTIPLDIVSERVADDLFVETVIGKAVAALAMFFRGIVLKPPQDAFGAGRCEFPAEVLVGSPDGVDRLAHQILVLHVMNRQVRMRLAIV